MYDISSITNLDKLQQYSIILILEINVFVHLLKSCYLYYSDYVLGMSEITYLAGLGKSVEKDNILLHRVAINIFSAVSEFVCHVDFDNGLFLPLTTCTN
jgi:hypothetical protein